MTETSKDSISKLLELGKKYPLVTLNFMLKTEREQNIENNQEIHEINKRLECCKRTNSLIIRNRQFDYFGHPCSKIVQIMSD